MRIALGADHAGVKLKNHLTQALQKQGLSVEDFGPSTDAAVDYPDFALGVATAVASGTADYGILVCGSGVGMAIAANKVRGVRAATVTTPDAAQLAREHNDANVLALGSRVIAEDDAALIVDTFLATSFQGGRHQRRVDKITAIESARDTQV